MMRTEPEIRISREFWETTWHGLKTRSGGTRESACVWAGERLPNVWIVRSVYFLDDLGPVSAGPLHHRASRECLANLFLTLRDRGESVVADVHCHPKDWVDLSPTDEAHPIEFRIGLLAIVVPNFASTSPELRIVGVHEYLGNSTWSRLSAAQVRKRFFIE
jgi:hypothetical protein